MPRVAIFADIKNSAIILPKKLRKSQENQKLCI